MAGYYTRKKFEKELDEMLKGRDVIKDSEIRGMFSKDVDFSYGSPVREMVNGVLLEKDISKNIIRSGRETVYTKDIDKAMEYELNNDISKIKGKKSFKDFFKEFKGNIAIFNKPFQNEKEYNEDTKKWTYHLEKHFMEKYMDKDDLSKYKDKDLYFDLDKKRGLLIKSYDGEFEKSLDIDSKIIDEEKDKRLRPFAKLLSELEKEPIRNKAGNRPKLIEGVDNKGDRVMILTTVKHDITVPYSAVRETDYDEKKDEKKIIQGTLEPMKKANTIANRIYEHRKQNEVIRSKSPDAYKDIAPAEFDDTNFMLLNRFANVSLDQMLDETQQKDFPYPDIAERLVNSMDNDFEVSQVENEDLEQELDKDEIEKYEYYSGKTLNPRNDRDGDGIGDNVDVEPDKKNDYDERERDYGNDYPSPSL